MTTKRFTFESPSQLEFGQVNSGFAKVKLSVLTDEQIANGTHFNREVINKNLNSLNYIPIVAEYKEEVSDLGTHGGKIIIDDDGMEYIETTKAYGVVIPSGRWEDIKLKNGETVPYVVCEGYLWIDRYPELQCLYEGKMNNQSMEVSIKEGHFNQDTWVYEVDDFEFSALCLLGKNVLPAFDQAKVMTDYSAQDFKAGYKEMLSALDIYLQNNGNKEVFNLENEILDEEVVVTTDEEFVNTQEETPVDDFEEEVKIEDEETDFEDNNEKLEDESEDKTEAEEEFTEEQDVESVDYEKLYNDLKIEYDKLLKSNQDLSEFKLNQENAEKQNVINAFSDRLSSEEMQSIVEKIEVLSKDELELQLFALVGKKADDNKLNFNKEEKQKIGIFTNKGTSMSEGLKAVINNKNKK